MGNQDAVVDTTEDFSKMKVVELKKLLKDRGLAVAGTKDELIERLKQANEAAEKTLLEENTEETVEDTTAASIDEELENEIMNEGSKGPVVKPGEKRKTTENGNTVDNPSAEKTEENKENSTSDAKLVEGKDQIDEPAKKIIKLSTITPEEKRELRAKKFGLTEEEKKEARAKRFGITPEVKTTATKPAVTAAKKFALTTQKKDDELLKKRAARFGLQGTKKLTPEEEEKRKKRAERFGISAPQTEPVKK